VIATVFDYGAGNLHSLAKALAAGGARVRLETDPVRALDTDALVLPGVGAFATAADRLAPGRTRMRDAIQAGLPCLGVCLGMQLLYESSEEGAGAGLGLLRGRVARLGARRIPHIGWNTVSWNDDSALEWGYFAHSFVARPVDAGSVVAWTTHEGDRFPAAVRCGTSLGVQFHPEKSSSAGLRLIADWLASVRGGAAMAPKAAMPCAGRLA
jgi:glutamine amidotransferase